MNRSVSLLTAACTALLLAGPAVRAADIPWQFNWTPGNIPANLKVVAPTSMSGNSYLQLTNEPVGKPVGNASGTSDVIMTGIKVFSDAPVSNPDHLDGSNPVSFTLRLTDKTSGMFHDFLFGVKFGGTISTGSALVTATFLGTSQYNNVTIGGNVYSVGSLVYLKPGPPDSTNPSGISATVTVVPGSGGKVQGAPEPSTMALSCIGMAFVGLVSWRKRRQAAFVMA